MNESDIQKKYSVSSQRIKDFLFSDELTETTKNIVILAKLNVEQMTELTEMIGNVLLGRISQINFFQEIEPNLKISPSQAKIINELAKKKIFEQFNKELKEYKFQLLEQKVPQEEIGAKEPIELSESLEIKPATKEKVEPIIPEYSFPEPSEVKVEKPMSKIEELKKVVTPTVSSEQQEKIREKLLAAMQKKETQPKILEQMKKVLLKPPKSKEKEEEVQEKKKTEELTPSKILSGEGKKFEDEEVFVKTKEEKPYILDVKLKEEKQEKKETSTIEEPIPYRKYQKKNPFGEA